MQPSESATFFRECDQDHDTKKEQPLYITFKMAKMSDSDWLL